jgi:hypothetical protein
MSDLATIDAPETSESETPEAPAAPVAVAPPVAPPTPPAKPGAPKLHDVMREREELQQRARELEKQLKSRDSEAHEYKSKVDAWRKDPYAAVKELGVDYQSLSKRILAGDSPIPLTSDSIEVQNLKAELEAFKAELGGVKSAAEKRAEAEKQAETQSYQRQWIDQGKRFVESEGNAEKYPYLRAADAYEQMLHAANAYEQEHGEPPTSYDSLAVLVEARLRSQIEALGPKLAKIPGFVKLITGHATDQGNPAESQATDDNRPPAKRATEAATPQRPMLTTKAASAAARSQGENTERRPKARWGNPHMRREALLAESSGKRR